MVWRSLTKDNTDVNKTSRLTTEVNIFQSDVSGLLSAQNVNLKRATTSECRIQTKRNKHSNLILRHSKQETSHKHVMARGKWQSKQYI